MFHNRVREIRRVLGVTQEWLAEAAGVGRATIADIEAERHIPTADKALLIAQALNREFEDIFYFDDRKQ